MAQVLHCNAVSCIHNIEERCTASAITVNGGSTQVRSNTYCASYHDDVNGETESVIQSVWGVNISDGILDWETSDITTDRDAPSIVCSAVNCKFNDNQACAATNVQIESPREHRCMCQTFERRR